MGTATKLNNIDCNNFKNSLIKSDCTISNCNNGFISFIAEKNRICQICNNNCDNVVPPKTYIFIEYEMKVPGNGHLIYKTELGCFRSIYNFNPRNNAICECPLDGPNLKQCKGDFYGKYFKGVGNITSLTDFNVLTFSNFN